MPFVFLILEYLTTNVSSYLLFTTQLRNISLINHISGTSLSFHEYLVYVYKICQKYIMHILEIYQVNLKCIYFIRTSGLSQAYITKILRISNEYFRNISGVSQRYLMHIDIDMSHLYSCKISYMKISLSLFHRSSSIS